MKKFIIQIILFFTFFGLIFLFGIMLPTTPRSKSNMLSYKIQKDSLLRNVESPRIILMGGSNLVFGLNSQLIKDSLKREPVNASMAVGFGLIYMMDDILPYIKEGDVVVLAPEYNHFFGNYSYGSNDLLRLLMDVDRSGFKNIRIKQIPNLLKASPIYFLSKFKYSNYIFNDKNNVYGNHIFNRYGDSEYHWNMERRDFKKIKRVKAGFNKDVIDELIAFNEAVIKKKAKLYITYPSFQKDSYPIIEDRIEQIEFELDQSGLDVISIPEEYLFPDSLMFDQVYHLNKEGADLRTQILIKDLKTIMN